MNHTDPGNSKNALKAFFVKHMKILYIIGHKNLMSAGKGYIYLFNIHKTR